MAGETIRDVILNLKIRMDKTGLGSPLAAVVAGAKQDEAKLDALANSAMSKLDKARAAWDKQGKAGAQHAIDRRYDRFIDDAMGGKNSPSGNATESAIVGKLRISGDAFKVATEGALHLARGYAFLTAASEEELQVVIRRIAYYQGLADIFRGGWDLTKGLTVGIRGLASAHTLAAGAAAAQATAETALATATEGVGGASLVTSKGIGTVTSSLTSAASAGRAFLGLMSGPVGWAALAGGVAAGAIQWARYERSMSDALQKEVALRKEQIALTTLSTQRSEELKRIQEFGLQFKERSAGRAERLGIDLGLINNVSQTPLGANADAQRAADRAAADLNFTQKRAAIESAIEKQRAAFRATAMSMGSMSDGESLQHLEARKTLMETGVAQVEQEKNLQRQLLGIYGEQKSALQSLMAAERQRFDANKAALKEEENRKKSLLERFGELRGDQQQQVKDIASQINKSGVGSLSQGQLDFAKQSGFFESALSKLFLQRGIAAGGEDVFKQGGTFLPGTRDRAEGQGENQTREDFLRQMQKSIESGEQKNAKVIKELSDKTALLGESLKESIEKLDLAGPAKRAFDEVIAKYIAEIKKWAQESNGKVSQLHNDLRESQLATR